MAYSKNKRVGCLLKAQTTIILFLLPLPAILCQPVQVNPINEDNLQLQYGASCRFSLDFGTREYLFFRASFGVGTGYFLLKDKVMGSIHLQYDLYSGGIGSMRPYNKAKFLDSDIFIGGLGTVALYNNNHDINYPNVLTRWSPLVFFQDRSEIYLHAQEADNN